MAGKWERGISVIMFKSGPKKVDCSQRVILYKKNGLSNVSYIFLLGGEFVKKWPENRGGDFL